MPDTAIIHKELSYLIVGCAQRVHSGLGLLMNFGEASLKVQRLANTLRRRGPK